MDTQSMENEVLEFFKTFVDVDRLKIAGMLALKEATPVQLAEALHIKPMLVLRHKEAPTTDALKVGIAVDGSKYGREAVKYVLRHLALFGAKPEVTLLHVVSDFAGAVMPDMGGIALPAFSEEEIRTLQKKAFEAAVGPARKLLAKASIKPIEVCLVGNAGDELSAYAKKKKLDVLVMGSHGYGAFKAAVLGSVATRVIAHSSVPLLLVRHA